MTWEIRIGDCRDLMRELEENSVDAIVTDPPYALGFMGKAWDRSIDHGSWATEALRVLKPGGHLLAFGGTRTYHRLACAIEDAGFEIRDTLAWLYGSGFPKSRNLGNGWGTALKPAHEPIVLARKPLSERNVAANVERWGTGGLNIDGSRVGTTKDVPASPSRTAGQSLSGSVDGSLRYETGQESGHDPNVGRWPANVVLDEEAARLLDEMSGERRSSSIYNKTPGSTLGRGVANYQPNAYSDSAMYSDTGGASRFFYVAKASRKERNGGGINDHPTVKPVALMEWLCKLVTPPRGLILDPFSGSGSTGIAAIRNGFRFLGFEMDAHYAEIATARVERICSTWVPDRLIDVERMLQQ